MNQPAIRVRNLFKKFQRGERHDSLRDLIASRLRRESGGLGKSEFWAIRDCTFEVAPGESLGIVGSNGAGKSTMLKLLAGIMRPDRGVIEMKGPVSPLIEVGAGFHGDLTGRENVFLNASVLGMTRRTTRQKFDEIIEFAGIGEFLDMPVKRYSSGMYARLGFAIAAHADPRVLLVDEVLSVGDRVFRARCMDRMRRFLSDGVAIVFVSHDMAAVTSFCHRTLVLAQGVTTFCGDTGKAIPHYYDSCINSSAPSKVKTEPAIRVVDVRLIDDKGNPTTSAYPGEALRLELDVEFDIDLLSPSYGLSLLRSDDQIILFETSSSRLGTVSPRAARGTRQRVNYDFKMNVPPGEYAVGVHVRDRDAMHYAMCDAYAVAVLVKGDSSCRGLVFANPQVRVTSSRRMKVAARPSVESPGLPA